MKKAIFIVVVLLLVGSLWMNLRSSGGITMEFRQGKTAKLGRGNLTIEITANGTIEPKERVEIKSEAGGVVVRTPYEVGAMVQEGDLLVELDPKDEQRLVDIAEKALRQARINLERSTNTAYQSEHVDLPATQARLDATIADLDYWKWKCDRYEQLKESGASGTDEYRLYKSNYLRYVAQKAQLEAELEGRRKNIELANLEVQQAELTVARAEDDLADRKQRLQETKIMAPSGGMLTFLKGKKGTVITSGSASFGGGTLLATLADVTELYVKAEIDESDIGRVSELAPPQARPGGARAQVAFADAAAQPMPVETGQKVKVTVEAFPEEEFEGVIDLIEPEAVKIGQVATYIVRIRLTSQNTIRSQDSLKLYLGMQANVNFVSESVSQVVLVPNEAVRYVANERGVYMPVDSQKTPGKKEPKFMPFKAGLDNGTYTQVISDLNEGDEVYTKLPRNRDGDEITGEE